MCGEEWRTIADWPDYEVSNIGHVRRKTHGVCTHPGRILKLTMNNQGRHVVSLHRQGSREQKFVHQLVARAFLGEPNGLTVNHKNMIKTDDRVENLEYITAEENARLNAFAMIDAGTMNYSGRGKIRGEASKNSKLTAHKVGEIRKRYWCDRVTAKQLGQIYGVSDVQIGNIVHCRSWSHEVTGTEFVPEHAKQCPRSREWIKVPRINPARRRMEATERTGKA